MTDTEKLTEEKIFQAATQVFEEKGMAGARMQEIADRASINKAMLHYYYRSKEKLFDAVFDRLARKMFQKFFACFDNDLSIREKLELFYKEHISFLQKNPKLPAFIFNELNQNPNRLIHIAQDSGIKQLYQNLFAQIDEEMQKGQWIEMEKIQILMNVLALSIFPFAARGLLEFILETNNLDWDKFIEDRKTLCPQFVLNAMERK